ncbi:G-type lectin S-receptor-like serine/threonine-protein kinase B120 [Morus notabilis]|uniref:G-type lectin S-receptor-like serine/threonine-protein kinase B120 n=1 Tax=Morus notabilis TaxID=981085 RepID=UPI000CECE963|nr:G-type lectin S-receptor-like serine/threonine-protein kinase B120 [Morus notabilis]
MTKSNTLSSAACFLPLILVSLCLSFTKATTKIRSGQSINVSETIASDDFELGFFSPQKNPKKWYVGIWYKNINDDPYVWVANREYPVLTPSATLTISSDGNLVIRDGRMSYMVTNITSTSKDVYAMLLNSGNFVLRENGSGNTLWQSFDHPTSTLLPGMKFSEGNSCLVSWKSDDDPSPGDFSLELDSAKQQLIVKNMSDTCFVFRNESKNSSSLFDLISFSKGYFTIVGEAGSEISRLLLDESGLLQLQSWSAKDKRWLLSPDSMKSCSYRTACNGSTPDAEHKTKKGIKIDVLMIALAIVIGMMLIFAIVVCYRRNLANKGENLLLFDVEMSLKHTHSELPDLSQLRKRGRNRKKPCKLVFFTFSSLAAATDNFSDAHKLGEGGFGPVYKGTLKKGYEVAIKRLSKKSGQGKDQFKTEAHLIARLQHNNLVRLLGCCIDRKEQILIYEYMPNKSLDFFLYDRTRCKLLTWQIRVKIIEGIAQGLLYLHQFSRIRIIHRDLKPSNILLDNDMNPKISDFGMARIFRVNQSHENTTKPAGTIGYMSPEYAHQGLISERSDVYSFGVLLLEILSGRKNTDSHTSETRGLLAYAWELWTTDRGLDLMDPLLEDASAMHLILRYVHIALLCVQEVAADRPNMSQVVLMLSNSSPALPYPKEPGFLRSTTTIRRSPAQNTQECCSVNDVTISVVGPR